MNCGATQRKIPRAKQAFCVFYCQSVSLFTVPYCNNQTEQLQFKRTVGYKFIQFKLILIYGEYLHDHYR